MPRFVFDNVTNAVVNNFCIWTNYQDTVKVQDPAPGAPVGRMIDGPNPESKNAYVSRKMQEYLQGEAQAGDRKTREAVRRTEDAAAAAVLVVPRGTVA